MRSFHAFAVVAFLLAGLAGGPALAQSGGAMPSCAAGDPVVWVNTSSKVYHMQGDQYYGKTKHGNYACKSAADSAGNHASGQKSGSSTKGTSKAAPSPAASGAAKHSWFHNSKATPAAAPLAGASPGPMKSSKHHHKSKPAASPAPANT